jgi:hypothetical protein
MLTSQGQHFLFKKAVEKAHIYLCSSLQVSLISITDRFQLSAFEPRQTKYPTLYQAPQVHRF